MSLGPEGMAVDPATGRFGWTPSAEGRVYACLRVTNAVGAATQCFDIDVGPGGAEGAARTLSVGCGCTESVAQLTALPLFLALQALAAVRRRKPQAAAAGTGGRAACG